MDFYTLDKIIERYDLMPVMDKSNQDKRYSALLKLLIKLSVLRP